MSIIRDLMFLKLKFLDSFVSGKKKEKKERREREKRERRER